MKRPGVLRTESEYTSLVDHTIRNMATEVTARQFKQGDVMRTPGDTSEVVGGLFVGVEDLEPAPRHHHHNVREI